MKTEYEVAKIQRENAVIRFCSDVLQAAGEVSDALVQLNKLEEQIDRAQSRKNILEKAIPNARLLFNSGMATYLEVITAQQNALQTELSLPGLKRRSEEHTSELQSLMRISYAVFCLKKQLNTRPT